MITLNAWRRSVCALAFEVSHLSQSSNLLSDEAAKRGEFFFSDNGIPKPRPCTALAWASLCSFGPIIESKQNLNEGNFLLPFLPKLTGHDEVNQSLARNSKLHERDSENRIRWGSIYIADASSGRIVEQLPHGQRIAKEWGSERKHHSFMEVNLFSIPPLWAAAGDGWSIGIIQALLPAYPITLRDPMIMLAKQGVPETSFGGKACPRINRLLFRFLDILAARTWAEAYADSIRSVFNENAVIDDLKILARQIEEKNQDDQLDKESGKPGKAWNKRKDKYNESILADFMRMTGNGG